LLQPGQTNSMPASGWSSGSAFLEHMSLLCFIHEESILCPPRLLHNANQVQKMGIVGTCITKAYS